MRRSYGGDSGGAAFDRSRARRRASRWFNIHPALLRSAVAVGVAAVAIVLVTSEALVRSEDETTPPAEGQVLPPQAAAASPALPPQTFGDNAPLATGTFAPSPTMTASLASPAEEAAEKSAAASDLLPSPALEVDAPPPPAPEELASPPAEPEVASAAATVASPDEPSNPVPDPQAEIAPPSRDLAEALALAAAEAAAAASTATPPSVIDRAAPPAETALPDPSTPDTDAPLADAEACPRDWVTGEAGDGAPVPAGCEPIVALIDPVEEEEQSAIEEAALEQATALGVVFARIPLPRPDPPPSRPRRTASRANLDWPAAPPPNCGTKHAYWRFVDRDAGTKEWYCK